MDVDNDLKSMKLKDAPMQMDPDDSPGFRYSLETSFLLTGIHFVLENKWN